MYKEKIIGIYCIENSISKKKYIGQSVNIKERWNKHKYELKRNEHDNDYLQNAWNKYGEDSFKFYILEECEQFELDDKEIYYIEQYNIINRKYGYNLKTGGQNNPRATEESNKKLSKKVKESYVSNPSLIEKRKKDALIQWSNPDIKNKITGKNNGMYGKHHTEEARNKISEKAKGRISSRRNLSSVFCIELNQFFECATIAAKQLGINSSSILQVCYGNRKTCGGYHWSFIEKE